METIVVHETCKSDITLQPSWGYDVCRPVAEGTRFDEHCARKQLGIRCLRCHHQYHEKPGATSVVVVAVVLTGMIEPANEQTHSHTNRDANAGFRRTISSRFTGLIRSVPVSGTIKLDSPNGSDYAAAKMRVLTVAAAPAACKRILWEVNAQVSTRFDAFEPLNLLLLSRRRCFKAGALESQIDDVFHGRPGGNSTAVPVSTNHSGRMPMLSQKVLLVRLGVSNAAA